jgi:hypothetical protein
MEDLNEFDISTKLCDAHTCLTLTGGALQGCHAYLVSHVLFVAQ